MKKLMLMFATLCGMLPVMASTQSGSPTAAGAMQGRLDATVDAVNALGAAGGDAESLVGSLGSEAEHAAGAFRKRVTNASNRGKSWADNIGGFFTGLNKLRHERGISNWDAGFGLGSLGALGTWLAYHGWQTRQARRQLALEKAKSKLATLEKKVQQAKTPEARSQALFEYRKAQREAITAFKHKNSWSRDWTDRLRGAWQGDYGVKHQVASAIAPALFATALTTHGIGHYHKNKTKSGDDTSVSREVTGLPSRQVRLNVDAPAFVPARSRVSPPALPRRGGTRVRYQRLDQNARAYVPSVNWSGSQGPSATALFAPLSPSAH